MAIRGALLTNTVDLTAVNPSGGLLGNYNSTVYDSDSIVSGSHFVIPSALNNKYGILTFTLDLALLTSGNSMQTWIAQNNGGTLFSGVTWNGVPTQALQTLGNGQATTSAWLTSVSGPTLLTTGDRYDVTWQDSSDTSVTIGSSGCFGLLVLDTYSYGYVVAKMSGDLTGQNFSTPTVISWDGANVLDSVGCVHSATLNNTKFNIPLGLNGKYVVVGANVLLNNAAAGTGASLVIRKNNSLVYTGLGGSSPGLSARTSITMSCQTQAIQVATNDFFEALIFSSDTSVDLIAARSNMWMMIVG